MAHSTYEVRQAVTSYPLLAYMHMFTASWNIFFWMFFSIFCRNYTCFGSCHGGRLIDSVPADFAREAIWGSKYFSCNEFAQCFLMHATPRRLQAKHSATQYLTLKLGRWDVRAHVITTCCFCRVKVMQQVIRAGFSYVWSNTNIVRQCRGAARGTQSRHQGVRGVLLCISLDVRKETIGARHDDVYTTNSIPIFISYHIHFLTCSTEPSVFQDYFYASHASISNIWFVQLNILFDGLWNIVGCG